MPKSLNIKAATQASANSCWACCARLVMNYFKGQDVWASDAEFAGALSLNVNQVQDMDRVLKGVHMHGGQDTQPFPTAAEIIKQIDKGVPLIVCVTTNQASVLQGNVVSGHYVVVCGYDGDQSKCLIEVMDPASGKKQWCAYDGTRFMSPDYLKNVVYWGVTYYASGAKL